ncbi:5397_t:CDS:1, partial [Gigaspora margarita]
PLSLLSIFELLSPISNFSSMVMLKFSEAVNPPLDLLDLLVNYSSTHSSLVSDDMYGWAK